MPSNFQLTIIRVVVTITSIDSNGPSALIRGYLEDISHLPENLNVTPTVMGLSISYQKFLLKRGVGASVESGGNWPDGFEKSFYDFVYAKWNKKESYRKEVFQKSRHFLPQE